MPEVTIETPKGQKNKTAKLEEEDLSLVASLSNKDQISDEQTKQTTCEMPTSNHELKNKNTMNNSMEKLETMNTKDVNIVMQNETTSDIEMLTSNNKQESQLEHQIESTENKPNIEHKNVPVDSFANKENKQGFTVVSRKKHRNKSRITIPKVGRTTVLETSASYTKARGLQ
ncbi:24662_t:CDS:2 [Cetraspora pellucida]|uniref:24662_t:CDS:1 n=1 Tax=Cetraspora pellucida TaxID=1433469 RepID=A0A9N9JGR5_9GLOM|nr:24662_t:CDS:2 [Cetraspora pellucida]